MQIPILFINTFNAEARGLYAIIFDALYASLIIYSPLFTVATTNT